MSRTAVPDSSGRFSKTVRKALGPTKPWPRGSVNPDRPFVCHEYLNLCVKCDPRDETRYTGVWQPPSTRAARAEWLAAHGLGEEWGDRLQDAQHALQRHWQKFGIESARKDPFCDGYWFWTITDVVVEQNGTYTAQGLFSPFWVPKRGGFSAADFARFNGPSCVLLDIPDDDRRVFSSGDTLFATFLVARLRAIGCKALLSNDNCGSHYASLQKAAAGYDYVDDHFYIDHPTFPVTPWRLPAGSRNENPIRGTAPLAPSEPAFTRIFGKPFTVSEWNFADPAQCRAVGALLAGAMAARQGWSGVFRFAYSHTRDGLGDRDIDEAHFFDLATDPLAQASERVVACLFARGDLPPLRDGVALWCTDESVAATDKTYLGAPPWCDAAWKMRVGTCLSPDDVGDLRAIRREEADNMAMPEASPNEGALRIDRERGSMAIATPRTCGGFAESGRVEAGALSFEIDGTIPSTVLVSSLDGEPIADSSRLLLSHLTDVQGEGTKYADETRRILISRGNRPLARVGVANVELRLANPSGFAVFALDSAGHRVGTIPASVENGTLHFRVSTRGPNGLACLSWEIAR